MSRDATPGMGPRGRRGRGARAPPAPSRNLADILRVQRVQIFTGAGTLLRAWGRAGGGAGQFDRAMALALDRAGNVYVADTENHRVQTISSTGTPVWQWGALPG